MISLKPLGGEWYEIMTEDKNHLYTIGVKKDELVILYKLIGKYIEKDKAPKKRKTKD